MDWGKRIKLVFDKKVWYVTPKTKDAFRLVETTYNTYIYPSSITYGANEHEIYLNFDDINQAVEPLNLEYLGGTDIGSIDLPMEAFIISASTKNLNSHGDYEYLEISNINIIGEITIAFDGKAYADEYLQLGSVGVVGENIGMVFSKVYVSECLQVNSITVEGQYIHIDDIEI